MNGWGVCSKYGRKYFWLGTEITSTPAPVPNKRSGPGRPFPKLDPTPAYCRPWLSGSKYCWWLAPLINWVRNTLAKHCSSSTWLATQVLAWGDFWGQSTTWGRLWGMQTPNHPYLGEWEFWILNLLRDQKALLSHCQMIQPSLNHFGRLLACESFNKQT